MLECYQNIDFFPTGKSEEKSVLCYDYIRANSRENTNSSDISATQKERCGCWRSSAHLQSVCHYPMRPFHHQCCSCYLEDICVMGDHHLHLNDNLQSNTIKHIRDAKDIQLSNGVRMPLVGLGTSHSGGYSHNATVYALKECGYRMIDTAKRYGTEEFIQHAIKESGVPREDVFLASKLWSTDFGYETTKSALKGTLSRLGTEYIDLFLIHWPEVGSDCPDKWAALTDTWRALECLLDEGLCRAIGVSNYTIDDLERQLEHASVIPMVNQIEFHPYQNPKELRKYCEDNKILTQGYCPLGKGKILNETEIVQIAERHGKTASQVLIRWCLQNGVPTIPKSTKEHRVKENIDVFGFELSDQEMNVLNSLHDGRKYIDGSKIKEKIDSKLPDGYKLTIGKTNSNEQNSSNSDTHRRQS